MTWNRVVGHFFLKAFVRSVDDPEPALVGALKEFAEQAGSAGLDPSETQ